MYVKKSPGKLYIAGEYAVVEKGYPSIIVAVDQFIEVSLKPAFKSGSIQAYDNTPIPFIRDEDNLVLDYRDNRLSYVINCITVVEELAKELNKELMFYDLSIKSDLEDDQGRKYGLGSSAAVTVSTIQVLCDFYDIKINDLQLFKLSSIVHYRINSNGSGGDLAASIYGGFISFKTFDRKWLKKMMQTSKINALINTDWPYLKIQNLTLPENLSLKIGWTGKPASTTLLVDKVADSRTSNSEFYTTFLEKSKVCVNKLIKAFEEEDIKEIKNQIAINRKLLKDLGENLGISIETKKLSNLIKIVNDLNGVAKTSGAGGGDCGIAFFDKKIDVEVLKKRWEKEGIHYLPLNVYTKE